MSERTSPRPRAEIIRAAFEYSLPKWRHADAPDLPQFCFAGRSNVGKSSMLNCLVNQKSLAKTSRTPGRTQALVVFRVSLRRGDEVRDALFVDLPGYGYAKAPKSVQAAWQPMIQGYLANNRKLRAAVLLLDIRHGPTPQDLEVMELLESMEAPTLPVATKADKLGASQRRRRVREMADMVGAEADDIRLFSAQTRQGRVELLEELFDLADPANGAGEGE